MTSSFDMELSYLLISTKLKKYEQKIANGQRNKDIQLVVFFHEKGKKKKRKVANSKTIPFPI